MTLQELQNALRTDKTLNIRDGQIHLQLGSLDATFPSDIFVPFYGGAGIEIADATPLQNGDPNKVVLTGRTSFPFLALTGTAPVQATFELLDNQVTLGITLRFDLPRGWQFLHSFPDLPIPFDEATQRYDYESKQSALDATFPLTSCSFYLTTYNHDHKVDGGSQVSLKKGLTFVGGWAPGAMLGFVAHIARGGPSAHTVHGQVIPLPESGLPTSYDDELPWDRSPRIPGIYLKAPLGSGFSFPPGSGTIQFTNLRVQTYSPLSPYWNHYSPSYRAETAYLGDVIIPDVRATRVLTVLARVFPGRDNELVFECRFMECTIDNIVRTCEALAGGADLRFLIPERVRDVIGKLEPQSASIHLVRPGSKSDYEVASTQLKIGMAEDARPWKLFDGSLEVAFRSVRISVVSPLDSQRRMVFLTFRGSVKFLNVQLNVTVEAPSLYCTAEQVGTATFDLQGYFSRYQLPWPAFLPPAVQLKNMRLQAQPGSYYSFAMSLDTPYKIDDKYSLPTLNLAVIYHASDIGEAYLDWQFEASTKAGEAVPVLLLIDKLAEAARVGIALPAAVKHLITVQRTAVAYNSRNGSFGFQCRGQLRFNQVNLDCLLTIRHTPEKPGPPLTPSDTRFGGEILLFPTIGAPPLSFALRFVKSGDSNFCVAAYSNEYGYALKVRSLVECVLPKNFADLIPDSLKVSLNSAFIAFSQKKQPAAEGGEPTPASDLLFGVDIGTSIKLSDLPVVGNALPKDLEFGLKSLRVMLASAAFSQESVQKFNELLPPRAIRLPGASLQGHGPTGNPGVKEAIGEGFSVSATLQFGKDTRTLTLPAMNESKGATAVTANASIPGQPVVPRPPSRVAAATTQWFDIEKSLGPITVRRIGLEYEAPRVGIKFDASLRLAVLAFNLEGLGLRYTLGGSTEPAEILKNLEFTLDGMGLALGNGPIEIGGSLMRVPGTRLELEGTLLIRTAPFTFSALGSYVDLNGTVSVTAFAVLLKELGDPTGTGAFVVTGLAFGFGVNRALRLPPIEEVGRFPLVQAAMGNQDLQSLAVLPVKLRDYVSPAAGNFWIAAGIKFNSFAMIDSFLLLSVSWGAEVEIGLLGLSRMTVPPHQTDPNQTIAAAELALRGVIRIADGLIQFEARVTENSYIFSKACRLTGGFAFCVWFAGPHAGDFVISLGGYHPAFQRPSHYPVVPRLGMQLQIGAELRITGEAYFALTPSCIMAGGKLCAAFKSGGIEAWFIAYADFLMNWQPFYYQAAMGITLGVALHLGALVIRLELSVDLKLQGPPFGGEARVTLWVISFTIPFGASAPAPPPLAARDFIKKCLPASKVPAQDGSPDVFSVRIASGLLREQEIQGKNRIDRFVNAHQFSLIAQSVVPCTKFEGLGAKIVATGQLGVRSMGKTELHSVFSITADGIIPDKHVKVIAITGNVPAALWGRTMTEGLVALPRTPESETIPATLGVRIISIPQDPVDVLPDIAMEKFKYDDIPKKVDWEILEGPPYSKPTERWKNYNSIWSDDSVRQRRDDVLECLRRQLPPNLELNEPQLERLGVAESGVPASDGTLIDNYFQQPPEMNAVGH